VKTIKEDEKYAKIQEINTFKQDNNLMGIISTIYNYYIKQVAQ
jgi:hypothetical protein